MNCAKETSISCFWPRQSPQQPTTSINHQASHILAFQKQISRDLCLRGYKDHETYKQNRLFRPLSLSQVFGSKPFQQKFQKLTASVLERKRTLIASMKL